MKKITKLKKEILGGSTIGLGAHIIWTWSIGDDEFHTDKFGTGLWKNDRQIRGTCDWRLGNISQSWARRKIQRDVVAVEYEFDECN